MAGSIKETQNVNSRQRKTKINFTHFKSLKCTLETPMNTYYFYYVKYYFRIDMASKSTCESLRGKNRKDAGGD
jgi:hypothetical protein